MDFYCVYFSSMLRELAASSLAVLTPLDPSYVKEKGNASPLLLNVSFLLSLSLSLSPPLSPPLSLSPLPLSPPSLSLSLPSVLPQVISQVTSSDTYCRHGSLHAVAEVTYGLAKVAHDKNQ